MIDIAHFSPADPALVQFDLAACRAQFSTFPHAFADTADADTFIVCATAADAQWARETRAKEPGRMPSCALVMLHPARITLGHRGSEADHRLMRQFAEWLVQSTVCNVVDDDGNDLTAACQTSLDILYA